MGDGSILPLQVLNHRAELGMDLTERPTAQTRQLLVAEYRAMRTG